MKDRLIKFLILAIIAAVLCAGFIYLDNVIVANAQDAVICPFDDPHCYYAHPDQETGPYPEPPTYDFDWCEWNECEPYPAPATRPFSFPVWLQVILDSITAFWL